MITTTVGTHVAIATPRIGFSLEMAEALGVPVALVGYKPVVSLTVNAVLGSTPALQPWDPFSVLPANCCHDGPSQSLCVTTVPVCLD